MARPRGRPEAGAGVSRDQVLAAAQALLSEQGLAGLSMRALAQRLNVTPMSLYRHVENRAGLLRALSAQTYADVLAADEGAEDAQSAVRALLRAYYAAVCRHPQLTLAVMAQPEAMSVVTAAISARLLQRLSALTSQAPLWRDILIDHAHGCGAARLASLAAADAADLAAQYRMALDALLRSMPVLAVDPAT